MVVVLLLVGCKPDAEAVSGVCDDPARCAAPAALDLPDVDLSDEVYAQVFVDGDRLYRASWSGPTAVYDIADPAAPALLPDATLDVPGILFHGHEGVLLAGPDLYDTEGTPVGALPEALERVTQRLASGPRIVGLHEPDRTLTFGNLSGAELVDLRGFDLPPDLCAANGCVLTMHDVTETHAVVDAVDADGGTTVVLALSAPDGAPVTLDRAFDALALGPEHLYAALDGDLQVFDLGGEVVGELADAEVVTSMVWGEGALVGTTFGGLRTFDLSDPEAPRLACEVDLDGSLYGRALHELVLYGARNQGMDALALRCAGG